MEGETYEFNEKDLEGNIVFLFNLPYDFYRKQSWTLMMKMMIWIKRLMKVLYSKERKVMFKA